MGSGKHKNPIHLDPKINVVSTHTQSVSYEGPIPDPHTLAQYEKLYPGMAKDIFAMARDQSHHRQHLEKTVVEGNVKAQSIGMYLGFILGLSIVISSFTLILLDKPIAGLSIIIAEITGLTSVYLYNRRKQSQERATKILKPPPSP